MRLTSLLLFLLALPGCRAHQTYFRGVDRSLFDSELEEMSAELSSDLSAQTVVKPTPVEQFKRLEPVAITSKGFQGRAEWSPDGDSVVFQSARGAGPAANRWEQTYLMGADGSNQRLITTGTGKTHGAVFIPGTDSLVVAYGSTHRLGVTPAREALAVGDSADHEMDLVRHDLTEGKVDTLVGGPGFDGEPHFCRDGRTLAFTSARTGDLEVYILGPRGIPLPITSHPGPDESPRLSPDCTEVVWVRRLEVGSDLVLAQANGTQPRTLLSSQASLHTPSFSPDGNHVLFASDLAAPGGQLDLFAVHRSGQDVRRITFSDGSERTPRLSPDGRRLLFSADGEGSPQLYVAPFRATEGTPWSIPQRDGSTP